MTPKYKINTGNQHLRVIPDLYSNVRRAFPLKNTTSVYVGQAFVNHQVRPYGIPKTILSYNGPQLS